MEASTFLYQVNANQLISQWSLPFNFHFNTPASQGPYRDFALSTLLL
jgi:hypothetical protein